MLHKEVSLESLNLFCKNTLVEVLGIEFTEIGPNYLTGKMPVDNRTQQPMGILHGGASLAFAETLGSAAAILQVDPEKQTCVGLEINANHIKSARSGYVYGKASPIYIGRKTHVWEIKITNDEGELICISRHTVAVLDKLNKAD
ncbi:PaaI family thioesterase [Adhaeribacter aquaticus]|uniref:PaaI family thioesterase n=1 Tax=Adhaeribacter aquaticus TaxID=299567 RepID=UPI00047A7B17|nr:PaaI family thioesterase [Adhaeribacter aquaticus]